MEIINTGKNKKSFQNLNSKIDQIDVGHNSPNIDNFANDYNDNEISNIDDNHFDKY